MDSAVLSLTCAGLGASQEDEDGAIIGYAKSDHCLDNLKDLQKFLRREVFKQVCKWKIASRDLVPIIENYQTDRNLVITAVKVLVSLTMPVEPSSEDVAQQIEYLWDLKAALTRNVAVTVIVSLLEDPLDRLERCKVCALENGDGRMRGGLKNVAFDYRPCTGGTSKKVASGQPKC